MDATGAYGAGKAGAPFDPFTFIQRPQVILRAVCLVSIWNQILEFIKFVYTEFNWVKLIWVKSSHTNTSIDFSIKPNFVCYKIDSNFVFYKECNLN